MWSFGEKRATRRLQWTFCGKRNTQWCMNSPAPTPEESLKLIPDMVQESLVQLIRTAYSISEQIVADFPILDGPLRNSTMGQLRYALVSTIIDQGVKQGLVVGESDWFPTANGSGQFMEYSFGGARVTFSSSHKLGQLPKVSNFRLGRANENQSTFAFIEEPGKFATGVNGPALLMLHGHKSLHFVQLMVPGEYDGKMISLAWSPNLVRPGNEGFGGDFGSVAVDPIPSEPLAEIALELRRSAVKKLKDSEG